MKIVMEGKIIANEIENSLISKLAIINLKIDKKPTLATIIVGEDPSSLTYVKMKIRACKRVGFNSLKISLKDDTTTNQLLKIIQDLNKREDVDGILLQHPVPKQIDEGRCFDAIAVEKDVDGVNSASFGKMVMKSESFFSATPLAIMKILEYYKIPIEGKNALIIGRSQILGKPIAMMLLNKNATVTIAHSKTQNLPKLCKKADIVVACVGKANFVKSKWLKKGVVIIDAGYNKGNVGDVDLNKAKNKASAYTPVPGGVGPMTIACLLLQTMQAFEKKNIVK